jgi:hypothetical protein
MELNADNLTKYTDVELENIEKGIHKEKKRRAKTAKIRAKLEKQANAVGYTLTPKDSQHTASVQGEATQEAPKEQKAERQAHEWNLGTYSGQAG